MEAALGLARLQFEEAQHQRARQAEQRGAEGGGHALERALDALLQLGEHGDRVAAGDLQPADGVGHRADGLEQAPEGAEQAEEDQQADQVAREVAAFIEARGDAVEHGARGGRRHPQPVLAFAQHGGERRQQVQRVGVERRRAFLTVLEAAQPFDLGPQRDDLADDDDDADHQHAHNNAVQDRRVHEHAQQVLVQHVAEPGDGRQEQQHADEIGERTAHQALRPDGARPLTCWAPGCRRSRHRPRSCRPRCVT